MRIQKRIFRATREGRFSNVRNLQKMLARSREATLVAVRRVAQINQGKYTAGIDGKICASDKDKEDLVEEIQELDWNTYKCSPVRRVYIPKPGKEEMRPLGIPTIKDRAMQMIVKLVLEPEFEAKFEQNSYGFRPGRRCMDAIKQIWESIKARTTKKSNAWILDADIKKCFDTIDHEALLAKIPIFRQMIRRWLKSGVIEFGWNYRTKAGTPQGGVISPLLANIALDGMDGAFGAYTSIGRYLCPAERRGINKGINVIRYADDFVVTAPSKEILADYVVPRLRELLRDRGLTLSEAKTRILHRDEGFDFLGFHLQQFTGSGNSLCVIKPSKEAIKRHLRDVKEILSQWKQVKQTDLIDRLNPVLRGWANYFRYSHAKRTFAYIDHRVWEMLWHWCKRRHNDKNVQWVKDKYFLKSGKRDWIFADKPEHTLYITARTHIRQYVKVKGNASPFDAGLEEYWNGRRGRMAR